MIAQRELMREQSLASFESFLEEGNGMAFFSAFKSR
jgi:hypothetical protein